MRWGWRKVSRNVISIHIPSIFISHHQISLKTQSSEMCKTNSQLKRIYAISLQFYSNIKHFQRTAESPCSRPKLPQCLKFNFKDDFFLLCDLVCKNYGCMRMLPIGANGSLWNVVFTMALYLYDYEIIRLFANNILVKPDLTAIQMMMMYYQAAAQPRLDIELCCFIKIMP